MADETIAALLARLTPRVPARVPLTRPTPVNLARPSLPLTPAPPVRPDPTPVIPWRTAQPATLPDYITSTTGPTPTWLRNVVDKSEPTDGDGGGVTLPWRAGATQAAAEPKPKGGGGGGGLLGNLKSLGGLVRSFPKGA